MEFVKRVTENVCRSFAAAPFVCAVIAIPALPSLAATPPEALRAELGRALFSDAALGRDGHTSCASCHDPTHAYADPRRHSIGVNGKVGTRNAPSLVGIASDSAFFWDGRRTRLEEVVADPFTNPVELGWPSTEALIETLRSDPARVAKFRAAFPGAKTIVTLEQLKLALAAFVRSLKTGTSEFDHAASQHPSLSQQVELGRHLFVDIAGCAGCHKIDGAIPRFTDNDFHHSGIGEAAQSDLLPKLIEEVSTQNTGPAELGPKLLTDATWSSLGRFVVSRKPVDIGAFRTPSLRNVAVTGPYMHDGSIATLSEAVDHEIYYRGFSRGRPINLSLAERQALVAFLESLTDAEYRGGTAARR